MSYWFTDCGKLGINVDDFVKVVDKSAARLQTHAKEIRDLGIREPVEVLIDNREVVAIKNPRELRELLARIIR